MHKLLGSIILGFVSLLVFMAITGGFTLTPLVVILALIGLVLVIV